MANYRYFLYEPSLRTPNRFICDHGPLDAALHNVIAYVRHGALAAHMPLSGHLSALCLRICTPYVWVRALHNARASCWHMMQLVQALAPYVTHTAMNGLTEPF